MSEYDERELYSNCEYNELPAVWQAMVMDSIITCINGFYIEQDEEELRSVRVTADSPEVIEYIEDHVFTIIEDRYNRISIEWEGKY